MIKDEKLPLKERFLKYYRQLPVKKLAAGKVGRTDDTITIWAKEDSDFSVQMMEAEADWADEHAKKVKSDEWLLERVMKPHFAPRTEHTGADGKDLPTPIIGNALSNDNSNQKDIQPE